MTSPVRDAMRAATRPEPVLGREREEALTERQRAVLRGLEDVLADGFVDLTMADLASQLNCSLRTLYALAPSRDELVLLAVDRILRDVGRSATRAVPEVEPLEALRCYLHAANEAVVRLAPGFERDLAAVPAAAELRRRHEGYLVDVAEQLLDLAVADGDIAPVDTRAVAIALATQGDQFLRGEHGRTHGDARAAANLIVDLVLAGLRQHR